MQSLQLKQKQNISILERPAPITLTQKFTQSHQKKLIQTEYQTHKKLKNLFYIKSKHTKKYFNNHPYFRMTTDIQSQSSLNQLQHKNNFNRPSLINQKRLKTQTALQPYKQKTENKQFVNYPTQFGLQNTYNYMKQKSFISKFQSQNMLKSIKNEFHNSKSRQRKFTIVDDQTQSQKNYMKITAAYQSKFYDTQNLQSKQRNRCLTQYQNSYDNNLWNQSKRKRQPIFRIMQKRGSLSIRNQVHSTQSNKHKLTSTDRPKYEQNNSRIKLTQSKLTEQHNIKINRSNIIYNKPTNKNPKQITSKLSIPAQTKYEIQFIFTKRIKSFKQIPYRTISFDLFPYLILTFLKCKVQYSKMSQSQFNFVHQAIIKTLQNKKKSLKYDIKDIINLSSVKQIIQFLQQFQNTQNDYQWIETIKYFFIVKEQTVLQYHLSKIKQDAAKLISIKFDAQFGQKQVFIFDLQKKTQVDNFYDLIQGRKFLIGDDCNVLNDYLAVQNQIFQKQTLSTKIKKWKSIADCSQYSQMPFDIQTSKISKNPSQSSKPSLKAIFTGSKKMSQQKFNHLFEQFKIRQKKRMSKNYQTTTNSSSHSLKSSFIQRSKLKKEQQFFQ